jgi:hypothetical protein
MQWDEWLQRSGQSFATRPVSPGEREKLARGLTVRPAMQATGCASSHRHAKHKPGQLCTCACGWCEPRERCRLQHGHPKHRPTKRCECDCFYCTPESEAATRLADSPPTAAAPG